MVKCVPDPASNWQACATVDFERVGFWVAFIIVQKKAHAPSPALSTIDAIRITQLLGGGEKSHNQSVDSAPDGELIHTGWQADVDWPVCRKRIYACEKGCRCRRQAGYGM